MKKQQYRNNIDINPPRKVGDERREEAYAEIFESSQILPRTVTHEDIDNSFRKWVEDDLEIISVEGVKFPTMIMFSNQRFSEYSQTWQHTDDNKNLLLNFKSITRENNPKKGTIYENLWNTPGQYYLIEKKKVLDDNGTESLLQTEMKMPTALDLRYKVSIFTTSYKKINEFNEKMNRLFDSCQVYIFPNGHPMSMKLENIQDESSYQIDDRQFYAQSYDILLKGYIITDEHLRITEKPLKECLDFSNLTTRRATASVDIDELENGDKELRFMFPPNINGVTLTMDEDFKITSYESTNLRGRIRVFVNDVECEELEGLRIREGDDVRLKINRIRNNENGNVVFFGK